MSSPAFRRILLKLSGEVLAGEQGFGIDPKKATELANEVKSIYEMGVSIGLIIGAGNIFRGLQASSKGMDRVTGDYLGMLATIMNAISLQDALEKVGVETRTLSAITVSKIAEPYIRRRALRHMEKGRVVIIAGGTGNPYFTTDTAAALRATELHAEVLIKGTKVDGVYDKDPNKFDDAVKLDTLSYEQALTKEIKVMDDTSIALARENDLPIVVCNMFEEGNLLAIMKGDMSLCSIVK
jgi:uridylate kinase